jgi:hypothetical protein
MAIKHLQVSDHSEQQTYETNVYLNGISYWVHMERIYSTQTDSWKTKPSENIIHSDLEAHKLAQRT